MQRSRFIVAAIGVVLLTQVSAGNEATFANPLGPMLAESDTEIKVFDAVRESPVVDRVAIGPVPFVGEAETLPTKDDDAAAMAESSVVEGPEEVVSSIEQEAVVPEISLKDAAADAGVIDDSVQDLGPPSSEDLPLGLPVQQSIFGEDDVAPSTQEADSSWILRTGVSLVAVIGLILGCRFALQWMAAKTGGGVGMASTAKAPSGLVEVLARYPISRSNRLVLLKIDSRILVVSQTSSGMSTLSEITDPDEVASILIKSRDEEGESIASKFTTILRSLESDPATMEDVDGPVSPRRALVQAQDEAEDFGEPGIDGAAALRNRLSRLGDISA